jgi:clan AA aspartic protease
MGLIYTHIKLSHPSKEEWMPIEVKSLVNTGNNFLCITEHIAKQLQLTKFEKREVMIADGSTKLCSYVGPIKIVFENRMCLYGALVLGNSVLLGAIPIEYMDLVTYPAQLKITINPNSPNMATAIVM